MSSPNRQLVVAVVLSLLFTGWVLHLTLQRGADPTLEAAPAATPQAAVERAPPAPVKPRGQDAPDAGPKVASPVPVRIEATPKERAPKRPAPAAAAEPAPPPTPPRAAAKGKPPPPPAHEGTGRLSLDTRPGTEVFLGQTSLGNTPLVNAELPAGHQVLQLVNEDKGISQSFEVDIRAGETTQKRLNLSP